MEEKEREQLKERLLKMVVNEPRPESMPPMTMAEVMVNSMSKPNLEPLLDFISQELEKAREEGREKISGHLLKVKSYGEEYSKDSNCDCNYLNGWNDCLKEIKKYLN